MPKSVKKLNQKDSPYYPHQGNLMSSSTSEVLFSTWACCSFLSYHIHHERKTLNTEHLNSRSRPLSIQK